MLEIGPAPLSSNEEDEVLIGGTPGPVPVLSPNLAHQVKWHRFVNTKGGVGNNLPCDLYIMNMLISLLKTSLFIRMGSNLTEEALQRAVRSIAATCMSTFDRLCQKFDVQSDVPVITTAHSTRSNEVDIKKVVKVILQQKILKPSDDGRKHKAFPSIHFNPLYLWNEEKTKKMD